MASGSSPTATSRARACGLSGRTASSSTSPMTGASRRRSPYCATARWSSGRSSRPTTAGRWPAARRASGASSSAGARRQPVRRIVCPRQMDFAHSETAQAIRLVLGSVLRARREAARRTLSEIAAEARLSPAHLSEVERGRKEVSTERLVAVAHALGIRPGEIYADLARRLGADPDQQAWPEDPPVKLRLATASLPLEALRSVADFSAYLAMANPPPRPKERIGFAPRR